MIDDDEQPITDIEAIRFPLPLPHSGDPETVENRISDRESNQTPAQSPATRSNFLFLGPQDLHRRTGTAPLEFYRRHAMGR